jgi:integrase
LRFGINPLSPSEESLLNYLASLDLLGKASSAGFVLVALKARFLDVGIPDPTVSYRVKQLVKGLLRKAAEEKIPAAERLPLPADAIVLWCKSKPANVAYEFWIRDAAIAILGFRCMRRPGEIGNLRRSHLWKKDGWFYLKVPFSKTDQLRKGKVIPIEPSDSSWSCPVKILDRYLASRRFKNGESLLFTSRTGSKLSTAAVSAIVKRIAANAKLEGKFSGHSLRIGGATAALQGGMTMEQIRAIGEWHSKAVLFYLRSIAAARTGASKKMGL